MKIEQRLIDDVRPYEANPRKNDGAVQAVAKSLREFGFRQPIVVDREGVIIVGHTRWKAARQLDLKRVPVHVAEGLSPEQARAYRIADNQTASIAEWDLDLLPAELSGLGEAGFELGLLGFDDDELRSMLDTGTAGLVDEDEAPEPPDDPITQPGDLWILGDPHDGHRLLCGDSASAEDVDRLLDGGKVQLVNTDPPYNVKVEPRSNNAIAAGVTSFSRREDLQCERSKSERGKKDRERQARKSAASHHQGFDLARHPEKSKPTGKMRAKDRPLVNDFVSDEEFERLLLAWFGHMARALELGRGFYIWGGYANCANYPQALKACGLYFSQSIIWDKQHPVLTRKDFMGAHEWCFYGWKEGAAHRFFGPSNVPDLWAVKKVNPQSMVHLTEKPVELARRAIEYSSRAGEHVLDLFGGSGSTLIACEQTGRKAERIADARRSLGSGADRA